MRSVLSVFSLISPPSPFHAFRGVRPFHVVLRRGSCTLGDCLNKFTESELLSGSDSYYCGRCKKHRKSVKEISIQRLPPVLVIHLKRFLQTRRQRTKIATNIDFPDRGLDLRELGCLSEYV